MSSQLARRPDGSGVELDTVALVFLAVALGPFAAPAAAALAALVRSRRNPWLWLSCLPGGGGALLLWPFARRRYLAALDGIHRGLGGGPLHLLALLAGEWWPVWLGALTLTPLLALAIVLRRPRDLAAVSYTHLTLPTTPYV